MDVPIIDKSLVTDRQLQRIRKVLGIADLELTREGLKHWAIVESTGGRWLGRIAREFRIKHEGRVWVRDAKDGDKVPTEWESVARVEMQPAFVMAFPAHAPALYVDPRGGRHVGSVHGETVFAAECSRSFHPVEQIVVGSLQRVAAMDDSLIGVVAGYIADAILGPKGDNGERASEAR